jgi:hypothetical protein
MAKIIQGVMVRIFTLFFSLAMAGIVTADPLRAPVDTGPDVAEPGSIEEIAQATTEARFMSPWVSYLPASSTVPSPRAFLHRIPGAPGELVNTATAQGYFRALAAASPRVRLFTIGRSEEGRDIVMLAIADEQGIANLEKLRAATAALADPRVTDQAAANRLIADARPIYYINAGPHSDETGSAEAMLELAYRLAVSEQPMIRRIRSNLVVLVNPVLNPDGRDKQVEWFYRYLKGKTDYATLPRQAPPYWSKYAYVDINRDAHQLAHESSKAVNRMFFDWHPTVVHDLHESMALLLTWTGTGPYNPNIDPLTFSELQELSFHEVQIMTGFGMPGVWTWNFGESFSQLYTESVAMNHNSIGRGYETFGNGSAETMTQSASMGLSDLAPYTSFEWYRVLPPPAVPFNWSARDNLNYVETGALTAMDDVAGQSKALLSNFYLKGVHAWRKGLDEAPYAFLIADDQGDRLRVAQLVKLLLNQHIEVQRASAPLRLKDGTYPAGTYVVRLDQPYGTYAVDLLSPQFFPKDKSAPYDDVSWELPAHYHLAVATTTDPAVRAAKLQPLSAAPTPEGTVAGSGRVYLLRDTGQESLLEARYRLAAFKIEIAEHAFKAGNADYPAGSWIIADQPGLAAALHELASTLALDFSAVATTPDVARHDAKAPRLGVWVPWADTDSIGWVRYSLDQRHVPYSYVRDEDIRAGHLLEHYDVILYGHVDLELAEQIHGIPKSWGPMPFKKTAQTPSFGTPAESDDITGGIGWEGLTQLQDFVENGGLLVTLGSGTMLALEGGIVRGVRRDAGGTPRSEAGTGSAAAAASAEAGTRTPGAHVRVTFDRPDHPIAYGYPALTHVFRQNYPLYSLPRRWLQMAYCQNCLDGPLDTSSVVLEWGDRGGAPLLVSGQVWGESGLIGRPAILDMPEGHGHVISFNFNPLHRDLNRGDQRLVWNAILNWQAILKPSPAVAAP